MGGPSRGPRVCVVGPGGFLFPAIYMLTGTSLVPEHEAVDYHGVPGRRLRAGPGEGQVETVGGLPRAAPHRKVAVGLAASVPGPTAHGPWAPRVPSPLLPWCVRCQELFAAPLVGAEGSWACLLPVRDRWVSAPRYTGSGVWQRPILTC